ncbi:hypothetical protein FACS189454_05700 [Planctomycetales bacterium]|nr:hypothetical protein FACS189454_05700 [Planctomycetales bacterium]
MMLNSFRFCVASACVLFGTLTVSADSVKTEYSYYTSPQGTSYIAIGLQGTAVPATKPNEVVFLIDTSASQVGQARLDTLKAVDAAINALPNETQIQIFAMDVNTEALTPEFVSKDSSELKAALKTLKQRVPLGATNFGKGLETVRKAFDGRDDAAPRSVLYLGDGRSMAKTMTPRQFEKDVKAFNAQKISFTACAVGVQTNFGFLGAFVNQTGGNLVDLNEDQTDNAPKAAGEKLAKSATATVIWADSANLTYPEDLTMYPEKLQPIRSDRATILVGKTESETLPEFQIQLEGQAADEAVELSYRVTPKAGQSGNNYLRVVVETVAKDKGAVMPITGWDSLEQIQDSFIANISSQIEKAEAAIETGSPHKALVLLNDVLGADPTNKQAQKLFEKAEKIQLSNAPAIQAIANQAVQAEAPLPPAINAPTDKPASALPGLVDAVNTKQSLTLQKVNNEVKQGLVDAVRRSGKDDPESAVQELKLIQQTVRENTALQPAQRDSLLDRIGNTLKQIETERFAKEYRKVQEEANIAKERSRQEAVQEMTKAREKAVQVFARFDSLMNAKEYQAAITVGEEATNLLQDQGLSDVSAGHVARRLAQLVYYIDEYEKLRYARHVGFIDSFMAAEKSFIPMPDEPPIAYIDRERWKLLTDYRKQRYSTVTLQDPDEFADKVSAILDRRDIRLSIDETTTFADVIKQIIDQLGADKIDIDLDRKALEESGEIRSDTVIAEEGFDHPGMKLRNALKMLLAPHDMTYIVKNEMLLLTTVEESKKGENMTIRVYPVADLVISPEPSGGMGGGMMGGGMGGMGGGMMGGGMGGMGGGMGGMGGGMGGGGMYSVPDEVQRSVPAQAKLLLEEALKADVPADFWTNYFNEKKADNEVIKETVRRLVKRMRAKEKVEDQVIALVNAALLNGQAEPWVYEALTLSLYLKGAPKQEIIRAALSAADFCDDPIDLMNIAFVMRSALGLKKEAFPLYQQALSLMTPKREFYSSTLRLAQELYHETGDEEAARWMGLAILSQEWDGALGAKLIQDASDLLTALSDKMRKQGRAGEAAQLDSEIKEAKLRDCVVTVEWTGDASVDLMVREPTDTYCWFINPRSMSGGLLKSPITVNPSQKNSLAAVKKVVYVCPRGFNGMYSLLLQKEWGTPANNLVKISVDTNVIPGETNKEGKAFPMTSDGIVVNFALENGRRTESVAEGELAAADLQASIAKQIDARNKALWRLKDDGILGQSNNSGSSNNSNSNSRSNRSGNNGNSSNSNSSSTRLPTVFDNIFTNNPAVGYQPEIAFIQQGATLSGGQGMAVVSPDRCYVRLSLTPMFMYYSEDGGESDGSRSSVMSGSGSSGGMGGSSGGYGSSSGGMSGGRSGGMGGMSGGRSGGGGYGGGSY